MERKYDIDVNFLKDLLDMIAGCVGLDKDIDLFVLRRLIRILENDRRKSSDTDNVVRQLTDDLECLDFYKPYYPFIKTFRNNGIVSSQSYKRELCGVNLSDEQTVSLVRDFYLDNGIISKVDFDDFVDDADGHLKFCDSKLDTEGETTFIRSTGEFFCLVPNRVDIVKATTLVHETTHIFDWYTNPDFIKNYLISEFNALFKELLSADYFARKLNIGEDGIKHRYFLHSVIKRYADDIYYRTQILHMFRKDGYNDSNSMIKRVFGEEYLKYLTEDSIQEDYIYQIAYLIAIELYTLYKEDKDRALGIADYLVENGTNDNFSQILDENGIQLNKHALSYEKGLRLKLKI